MLAQLQKHDAQTVFFDKDRGAEIFVRAIGGTYLPLRNGDADRVRALQGARPHPEEPRLPGSLVRKLIGQAHEAA